MDRVEHGEDVSAVEAVAPSLVRLLRRMLLGEGSQS